MRLRLRYYWEKLWSSFWFVPALMTVAAVLLSWLTLWLDYWASTSWITDQRWINAGTGDGAIAVLSTISGSMISIATVVFSLTVVALTMTSSQFGPRLLRNFMRDRSNQLVLGTFIATFVYSLLLLRTVKQGDSAFVPHLSVGFAVLMAISSLAVLIYFIHHVSVSIQADSVIASVNNDLEHSLHSLFPDRIGERAEHAGVLARQVARDALPVDAARILESPRHGYLQMLDHKALMRIAQSHELVIELLFRPGEYIIAGEPMARVWPDVCKDEVIESLKECFILDYQRTPSQDILFSVNQLVEIAVRALSPGINDPFTAITCIDRLGSALSQLAQRELPSGERFDEHGALRIIAPAITFCVVIDTALNQIRQNAVSVPAVLMRLQDMLNALMAFVEREEDRDAVLRHSRILARATAAQFAEAEDRHAMQVRINRLTASKTSSDS